MIQIIKLLQVGDFDIIDEKYLSTYIEQNLKLET